MQTEIPRSLAEAHGVVLFSALGDPLAHRGSSLETNINQSN